MIRQDAENMLAGFLAGREIAAFAKNAAPYRGNRNWGRPSAMA
jgi:hypothetical protein